MLFGHWFSNKVSDELMDRVNGHREVMPVVMDFVDACSDAINDDGNLLDASAIAAVAALKMTKIPVYDEEDGVKYGELTKESMPLTEEESLMMTFYKIGDKLVFDPTRDEEDSSSARLTLAISKPGKDKIINSMQKGGLDSLSTDHLNEIIAEAEKVYDRLFGELGKMVEGLGK